MHRRSCIVESGVDRVSFDFIFIYLILCISYISQWDGEIFAMLLVVMVSRCAIARTIFVIPACFPHSAPESEADRKNSARRIFLSSGRESWLNSDLILF